MLEEDCMYQLEKNSSVAVVVSDVKAELCPQNCNNNGKCVDGKLYVFREGQTWENWEFSGSLDEMIKCVDSFFFFSLIQLWHENLAN